MGSKSPKYTKLEQMLANNVTLIDHRDGGLFAGNSHNQNAFIMAHNEKLICILMTVSH